MTKATLDQGTRPAPRTTLLERLLGNFPGALRIRMSMGGRMSRTGYDAAKSVPGAPADAPRGKPNPAGKGQSLTRAHRHDAVPPVRPDMGLCGPIQRGDFRHMS
jgi:hypothetical protein